DVVPKLPGMFDEPFSDASQIPTFLVAQLARRNVTVGLSGDGGDELFGGYRRYFAARSIERGFNWLPPAARRQAARSLVRHRGFYESLLASINGGMPARLKLRRPQAKVGVLADMLQAGSQGERYQVLMSHHRHPAELVLRATEPALRFDNPVSALSARSVIERMMLDDLVTYLPGDILAKVDRASMAVSLEARVARAICTEGQERAGQVAAARSAVSPCPAAADGSPQAGLWGADRRVAAGAAARLGGSTAGRAAAA